MNLLLNDFLKILNTEIVGAKFLVILEILLQSINHVLNKILNKKSNKIKHWHLQLGNIL